MNIIGNKKIFLTIAALLVGASVVVSILFGFKEGIDFKGGTLWRFGTGTSDVSTADIEATFKALQVNDVKATFEPANKDFLVRLPSLSETDHQRFSSALREKYSGFTESSFQSIGPSVGAELRKKSIMGIIMVLIGISLYIAFAFRKVYRPVSSWKYGFITLVTLFHDVALPAGLLAILGHYLHIEIDSNFIVALLVVMGFSVHDTIVVFDRIRENLFLDRGKTDFSNVVNRSVNETMARSINTSLTLILVLLALYFTGPATLKYFILTLLVGVTTGIYSSIFVASPLLTLWQGNNRKA